MTVKDIIINYLAEHGYDGLCGDECGCSIEDLSVCESCPLDCEPGYKTEDPSGEAQYLIMSEKPGKE